ncbi:MAG TPA: hypothetical protein VEC99_06320 [Clostridia bacterium]|nr:hypothetical protein [Clostridia bacterium]
MSLFTELKYEVKVDAPGRLCYREGNHEYVFPVYEEDGDIVIAGFPSSRRVYYFFGWYSYPRKFPESARDKILPRLVAHFSRAGRRVRVFEQGDEDSDTFAYYPELFEQRGKAIELLDEAGITWFGDYSSIDLLHEEYGLEVSGIRQESKVDLIAKTLKTGFPQWHYQCVCHEGYGREPGWRFSIYMFSRGSGGNRG